MSKKKIIQIARTTKEAAHQLNTLTTAGKNRVLKDLASTLVANTDRIIRANREDVSAAKEKGLQAAMIERLVLDPRRIKGMHDALLEIAALPDPVGEVIASWKRKGLKIKRVRIPLGVIGMIYESRPNVTIDAFSLCFKSGNAIILRGGSEAFQSNKVLVELIRTVLKKNKVNPDVVAMVPFTDRAAMAHLLKLDQYIDLVIPRGGEGLMRFIAENARVPVIKHDKGVCSIFVDESADLERAVRVIENAKVQRPAVCNAVETVYVHKKIAGKFLPRLFEVLDGHGVEIRGDAPVKRILPQVKAAREADFGTEYLDLILAVKTVNDVNDAIRSIRKYSSNHTESILTNNKRNAGIFCRALDSSCVMVNTSTRFNDGGQLGLGAEIGISTTKLHAYGPMGLKELTTAKFVVESDYKVRSE